MKDFRFPEDEGTRAQTARYLRDMVYAFSHIGFNDENSEAWWEAQYEPGMSSDDVRRLVWNESKAFVEATAITPPLCRKPQFHVNSDKCLTCGRSRDSHYV